MLSTHIMQEVEAICDRVIIVNKGRIVADKDAKTIVASSSKAIQVVVVEFGEEVLSDELRGIPGLSELNHVDGNTFELSGTDGSDMRKAVFDWAVENKRSILSQNVKQRSLEEVFKELTK